MKFRNKVVIICSIILIILSLAILLFSCIFYKMRMNELEAKAKELREEQKEQIIEEYETKNQFIGINNCFLGMVTPNNEWISANDFRVEYSSFKLGENVKSNVIKDEITADDITVYVDLANLEAGEHEVDVKVTGNDSRVEYLSSVLKIKVQVYKK